MMHISIQMRNFRTFLMQLIKAGLCLIPARTAVMPIFFRILYTSGMRVSELRLARIRDVNLEKGYIHVLEAKNHKERLIPIHPLLMLRCRELKEKIHATSPDDEYFFMILPGKPMYIKISDDIWNRLVSLTRGKDLVFMIFDTLIV